MSKLFNFEKMYRSSIDQYINWKKHLKEWGIAIIVALLIRELFITIYMIPTGSMIPTFKVGDVLVANRFYYGLKIPFTEGLTGMRLPALKKPAKGDVIIFEAPSETEFYYLRVHSHNASGSAFLEKLNRASKRLKRPMEVAKGYTNYIFITDFYRTGIARAHEGANQILLHGKLYRRYIKDLREHSALDVAQSQKHIKHMTYYNSKKDHIILQIFDMPFKGVSIAATVLINSPFLFIYKNILAVAASAAGWDIFSENADSVLSSKISFYPNPYVDMTKDYVKRLVGLPGDMIEVRSKVLYVNGKRAAISRNFEKEITRGTVTARIHTEKLPAGEGNIKEHPVRFADPRTFSTNRFQPQSRWPYDPDLSRSFRDHIGPFQVPEGYYFVMGDNRDESFDSRFWGCVPMWAVKGTPMFIFLPLNRAGFVK